MFSRMLDRVDPLVGPAAYLDITDLSALEGVSTDCCRVSKLPAHRPSLNIPHTMKPHGTIAWIIDRKFCTSATSLSFTTFCEQYNIHERRIASGAFKKLLSTCPGLTSLDLSDTVCKTDGYKEFPARLSDDILADIIEDCSRITTLNISGCYLLSNRAIEAIASSCPMLKSLNISGCFIEPSHHITAQRDDWGDYDFWGYEGPLRGITHDCMMELKTGCPHLTTIYVAYYDMKDYGIKKFEKELNCNTTHVKTRVLTMGYDPRGDIGYKSESESESDSDDLSSLL
jgi:hypothetical protein